MKARQLLRVTFLLWVGTISAANAQGPPPIPPQLPRSFQTADTSRPGRKRTTDHPSCRLGGPSRPDPDALSARGGNASRG